MMVPCPLDWTGVSLEVCRLAGLFLWFIATRLACIPGGSYVSHGIGCGYCIALLSMAQEEEVDLAGPLIPSASPER